MNQIILGVRYIKGSLSQYDLAIKTPNDHYGLGKLNLWPKAEQYYLCFKLSWSLYWNKECPWVYLGFLKDKGNRKHLCLMYKKINQISCQFWIVVAICHITLQGKSMWKSVQNWRVEMMGKFDPISAEILGPTFIVWCHKTQYYIFYLKLNLSLLDLSKQNTFSFAPQHMWNGGRRSFYVLFWCYVTLSSTPGWEISHEKGVIEKKAINLPRYWIKTFVEENVTAFKKKKSSFISEFCYRGSCVQAGCMQCSFLSYHSAGTQSA